MLLRLTQHEWRSRSSRGFESFGERAADLIERTRGLIARIRAAPPASD
jgi:hypothetical protein